MELTVFLAVLAAALMHASWNLLVKLKLDRFLSLFLLQTLMGLMGIAMLFFFAWPARASLPYALVSGVLHTGYNIFLARSYRDGDLSLVYPIARGAAPLITLLATWLVASEQISAVTAIAIGILVSGIWLVAVGKSKSLKLDRISLFFALGTSCFIAAYTVVDGLGGRISGAASGYTAMVFILDAVFMLGAGVYMRGPGILKKCRALLEKRHCGRPAFRVRLLDCHMGHDPGANCSRCGASRNQHPVCHSHVGKIPEGTYELDAHFWRCPGCSGCGCASPVITQANGLRSFGHALGQSQLKTLPATASANDGFRAEFTCKHFEVANVLGRIGKRELVTLKVPVQSRRHHLAQHAGIAGAIQHDFIEVAPVDICFPRGSKGLRHKR